MNTIKGVWTLTQTMMDAITEEAYEKGYRDAVRELDAKRLQELKDRVGDLLGDGEGERE